MILLNSTERFEFIDITSKVQVELSKSKIKNGLCHVYCPHTTAGLTINEGADPFVKADILKKLREIVPENDGYEHIEGNSDSHIMSSLVGAEKTIPIKNGKLQLGTWQSLFFTEFDGPRNRKVIITVQ
ncbi:secondary thiamine-phosphate synthase enzyme YjbQ [Candidatus Undinarchaeota archaeon]